MTQAVLIGLYCTIFCMVPILSNKVMLVGQWQLLAGVPFMSLAYMMIDLLNENWGPRVARSAVLSGMIARAFIFLIAVPAVLLTPGVRELPGYGDLLFQSLRLFVAAEVGIFVSQWMVDIPLFQWVKRQVGGGFWLRYNLTTHLSAILTILFVITVVFWGNPNVSLPNMLLTAVVARVILTALFTPLAAGANWLIREFASG